MTLTEQVYAQARLMAQGLGEGSQQILEALCASAVACVRGRLRDNVEPEDCLSDFVTAAAMYALAAVNELGDLVQHGQVEGEDLTLRSGSDAAANCLKYQAELLMRPYFKQPFVFVGA